MDKNLVIDPPLNLDDLDLRIYKALPRRWGDCNSTIIRKKERRMIMRREIEANPVMEMQILVHATKYDIYYEQETT